MSGLVLYSLPNSFYSARCRAVVYGKGIDVAVQAPPGGLGSETFRSISPLGKVPALTTPSGVLVESQIICEYLEERHPAPAFLPSGAWPRARNLLLCRYVDLYLAPPFTPIWRRLRAADLRGGLTVEERTTVRHRFAEYEALFTASRHSDRTSLADCAVVPVLFLYRELFELCGEEDPLASCPGIAARFETVRDEPALARVLGEMEAEVRRRRTEAGR